MLREELSSIHWNYLVALDSDLENLSRYIEFHEDNFGCFSIELARLLLMASSEVDVVAKAFCASLDGGCDARHIGAYKEYLVQRVPELADETVRIDRYHLLLQPWEAWKGDGHPQWWNSYNDVKHHRDKEFFKANLKNALDALAALYILLFYYYYSRYKLGGMHDKRTLSSDLKPELKLLRLNEEYYHDDLQV